MGGQLSVARPHNGTLSRSLDLLVLLRLLRLDLSPHFRSVDRNAFGRLDAQSHLVAPDLQDGDDDTIVHNDALILLPRQD